VQTDRKAKTEISSKRRMETPDVFDASKDYIWTIAHINTCLVMSSEGRTINKDAHF
jgi:hypothetical protein